MPVTDTLLHATAKITDAATILKEQNDRLTLLINATVDESKNLTNLSLSVLAGSLLLILSTDYVKPPSKKARYMYVLFFPAWFALLASVFFGNQIARRFPIFKFAKPEHKDSVAHCISDDFYWQLTFFEVGVFFFFCWLMCYLIWWIFYFENQKP